MVKRLIDMLPFPWDHDGAEELRQVFVDAFGDNKSAKRMVDSASGALKREINWEQGALNLWYDIITKASDEGCLEKLVFKAHNEAINSKYKDRLALYLEQPAEKPEATNPTDEVGSGATDDAEFQVSSKAADPAPSERAHGIEAQAAGIEELAERFGKVGVLIDDHPDAPLRLAREFYGSETLPEWWIVARSAECGNKLLKQCWRLLKGHKNRKALIIVDRYLPAKCRNGGCPVLPWDDSKRVERHHGHDLIDGPQKKLFEDFKKTLSKMVSDIKNPELEEHRLEHRIKPCFISSFPVEAQDIAQDEESIRWTTKQAGAIHDLRYAYHRDVPEFLHFGPLEKSTRAYTLSLGDRSVSVNENNTANARFYSLPTRLLSDEQLHSTLITGWEAESAQTTKGAGLPSHRWLVNRPRSKNHIDPTHIFCHSIDHQSNGVESDVDKAKGPEFSATEGELMTALAAFCHDNNKFYSSLREAVQRYDTGFSYHQWRLIQFPWNAVISTGVSNSYSRCAPVASQHVAQQKERKPNSQEAILRYGSEAVIGKDSASNSGLLYRPFAGFFKKNRFYDTDHDFAGQWGEILSKISSSTTKKNASSTKSRHALLILGEPIDGFCIKALKDEKVEKGEKAYKYDIKLTDLVVVWVRREHPVYNSQNLPDWVKALLKRAWSVRNEKEEMTFITISSAIPSFVYEFAIQVEKDELNIEALFGDRIPSED